MWNFNDKNLSQKCQIILEKLLNGGGEQRAFRVIGVGATVFDFTDNSVKNYFVVGQNYHYVARTIASVIYLEFNHRRVAVFVVDGFVIKGIGVITDGLAKGYFRHYLYSPKRKFNHIGQ